MGAGWGENGGVKSVHTLHISSLQTLFLSLLLNLPLKVPIKQYLTLDHSIETITQVL